MEPRTIVFAIFFVNLFVSLPLGITSIVLSQEETDCDYEDSMGLDISDYLLGLGIFMSVVTFNSLLSSIIAIFNEHHGAILMFIFIIFNFMFSFSWFIVGGIILFRSNVDCINEGGTVTVFALVMWCLSAFSFLNICNKNEF